MGLGRQPLALEEEEMTMTKLDRIAKAIGYALGVSLGAVLVVVDEVLRTEVKEPQPWLEK